MGTDATGCGTMRRVRALLRLGLLLGACLTPACCYGEDVAEQAAGPAALPESASAVEAPPASQLVHGPAGASLFIAVHKTSTQRYSDSYLLSGKKRRRPIAASMRLRRQDDANFTNRTRFLARRVAGAGQSVNRAQLARATTGAEFLEALVEGSRRAPIANLVVYGHAASTALFGREDRGFYASVPDVAKGSRIVSGTQEERDAQLRADGARDLSDFQALVARGDIRFTRNPVIVFAGCGVAGKRQVDPHGIAARLAELLNAKVIASIDVTDQSMARGRNFRNHEYSRRTWVRFHGNETPQRLNTRVIDALRELNFAPDVTAAAPAFGAIDKLLNEEGRDEPGHLASQLWIGRLLAPGDWLILATRRAGIELARAADLLARVLDHLLPLRDPADSARDREQHGEHRGGEAHRL
jgi:hypothetical protein